MGVATFYPTRMFPLCWINPPPKDQVIPAGDRNSRVLHFPHLLTYHGSPPDRGRIHSQLTPCGRVLHEKGAHFPGGSHHNTHLTWKQKWTLSILLIPQHRASAAKGCLSLSSGCLGHITSLLHLLDVKLHIKIISNEIRKSPVWVQLSRWLPATLSA